jgi:broad specificity phosphatase PhoE
MKIYLVRHGESQSNEQKLFVGQGDVPLSEHGLAQAKKTAEFLKNIEVDAIYSSDLTRAFETAMQTAKLKNLAIIKDAGLRELNIGKYEFTPYEIMLTKYSDKWNGWLTNFAEAFFEEGESVKEVQDRVVKTITKIAEQNANKTVFIFSHATSIRCFAAYCNGDGLQSVNKISWVSNASVTEINYENGQFKIIDYGKDDFMGELRQTLPNRG